MFVDIDEPLCVERLKELFMLVAGRQLSVS